MNELLDGRYLIRLETGIKKSKYRINVSHIHLRVKEAKSLAPLWEPNSRKHRTMQGGKGHGGDSGSDAIQTLLDDFEPVNEVVHWTSKIKKT